jgi:hypothetical protein
MALDDHDHANTTDCNTLKGTEKDSARRNATCGILAVSWTCGIVIGLAELYGCESKSQVFAYLIGLWAVIGESLLGSYSPASRFSSLHIAGDVPRFFGYDDACHLIK